MQMLAKFNATALFLKTHICSSQSKDDGLWNKMSMLTSMGWWNVQVVIKIMKMP